ncbi:MAG: DUF2094 domain-containing protein [Deltaproteobacteria bacterium]|nr:DUF2094 domain-containing protein [Deltaproteobacteria bacterium]
MAMVWQWAARGKHPAAKDYFQLGSQVPMVEAFYGWFESGFQGLAATRQPAEKLCSWRFWAKGPNKDVLVCGLGKDSSDSVGRPFPMVIIGTGGLPDWRNQWDLLPLACEGPWTHMEYLAAKPFSDLAELEAEIAHIKPPSKEWQELNAIRNAAKSRSALSGYDAMGEQADDGLVIVTLDEQLQTDVAAATSLLHGWLRQQRPEVPTAVFIGGNSRWSAMAVFRRALAPRDFASLWCREAA